MLDEFVEWLKAYKEQNAGKGQSSGKGQNPS